jgi:CxxC motif-containing protein (DUF1111 family)
MKAARAPFVLATFAALAIAGTAGPPVSAGAGHGQLGKPLDGITMDQRKLFRDAKDEFEQVEGAAAGLGPIFNNVSCVACHFVPAVGGSSPINETRAQRVAGGNRFDLPGGSLFQSDAIGPNCRETVPADANVIAKRQTTPLFGSGLIEAIPDAQIEAYSAEQASTHPGQAGLVNHVVDVVSGTSRVGRFGWKAQQATLLAFSGDAYVNEMGITNRFFPFENAPNGNAGTLGACDAVPDPEDTEDDIVAFESFMRLLAPPPRDHERDHDGDHDRGHEASRTGRGERVFERVGCAVCHRAGFTAVSPIAAINGQTVDAFSDFLLHDVGTGDGIVQGEAPANVLRTPPLWGISDSAPYLHDGSAATISEAIRRHANQGAAARDAFQQLSHDEQQALLEFLDSI